MAAGPSAVALLGAGSLLDRVPVEELMTAIEDDLTRALNLHRLLDVYRDDLVFHGCTCHDTAIPYPAEHRITRAEHRAHLAAVLAPIVAAHVDAGQERAIGTGTGGPRDAAKALAHMPGWVAVESSTLAKLDVALTMSGLAHEHVDELLRELDESRNERDLALGTAMDQPTTKEPT